MASVQNCPLIRARSAFTYVSALSLWALVSGHWSSWQAARIEVAQEQEIQRQEDEPVEDKVVKRIVEKTNVEPSLVPEAD